MRVTQGSISTNHSILNGPNVSIAGNYNTINGDNCTVQGNYNKINSRNCKVFGNYNKLYGADCHVQGNYNTIYGSGSTASGMYNTIVGKDGRGTADNYGIAQMHNFGSVVNTFSDDGFISSVGNGSSGGAISISMGPGGMRIFKDGVEQEPFMKPKKEKKKKHKRKEEAQQKAELKFIEGPTAADLAADKEAKDNEAQCIICLTNVPCCIAYPCNHLSFCVSCARTLCFANVDDEKPRQVGELACPKCKGTVEKMARVFE